jgi:outer membrane protein assembly factor BamB
VLDRTNGQVLLAKQFLRKLNWADGIGKDGRPILKNLPKDANGDTYVCPGFQGGANWYSTSFNPATGFYYFSALERCNYFSPRHGEWQAGKGYMGGAARPAPGETFRKFCARSTSRPARCLRCPSGNDRADRIGGRDVRRFRSCSTANSGSFMAVDAANGKILWQFPTNQVWKASPMTCMFDNKQYVDRGGTDIVSFGLPE